MSVRQWAYCYVDSAPAHEIALGIAPARAEIKRVDVCAASKGEAARALRRYFKGRLSVRAADLVEYTGSSDESRAMTTLESVEALAARSIPVGE